MNHLRYLIIAILSLVFYCISSHTTAFANPQNEVNIIASFYSSSSLVKEGTRQAGEKQIMANGKEFNENAMTCASRLYPLNTKLRITNTKNNKTVLVVVTDRIGKRFAKTRIDLSKAAFAKIADLSVGIIKIKVEVIIG
ncbi:MAG: septal ring lytic transglycosylase RlpA family protein [Candidatus Absconditabacterales bacterium]|jgi:rare lipoprotein A